MVGDLLDLLVAEPRVPAASEPLEDAQDKRLGRVLSVT
jgi:hypothetical protein